MNLEDWCDRHGGKYHISEKIGSRKQSSGEVCLFEGTPRYGDGAYIAFASEYGPRGNDFVSIGLNRNQYYNVNTSWNVGGRYNTPDLVELENPDIKFLGDKIIIKKEDRYNDDSRRIVVTPK